MYLRRHIAPYSVVGQGRLFPADRRPVPAFSQAGVGRDAAALRLAHNGCFDGGVDWALGRAHQSVDAAVGVDHQEVWPDHTAIHRGIRPRSRCTCTVMTWCTTPASRVYDSPAVNGTSRAPLGSTRRSTPVARGTVQGTQAIPAIDWNYPRCNAGGQRRGRCLLHVRKASVLPRLFLALSNPQGTVSPDGIYKEKAGHYRRWMVQCLLHHAAFLRCRFQGLP